MDTTRILVFTAKRGDIPVLEFRFTFIYIRTCISSLKEKKKNCIAFLKICWRKNLKKKKKKGRISTYHVTRARKKNQILSLQQNESRESSKRPINKVSLKLHATSFHWMNSLHPSLLTFCARHTTKTCARWLNTRRFFSKVKKNTRARLSEIFASNCAGQIFFRHG